MDRMFQDNGLTSEQAGRLTGWQVLVKSMAHRSREHSVAIAGKQDYKPSEQESRITDFLSLRQDGQDVSG